MRKNEIKFSIRSRSYTYRSSPNIRLIFHRSRKYFIQKMTLSRLGQKKIALSAHARFLHGCRVILLAFLIDPAGACLSDSPPDIPTVNYADFQSELVRPGCRSPAAFLRLFSFPLRHSRPSMYIAIGQICQGFYFTGAMTVSMLSCPLPARSRHSS